jgi:glutathione reductase (NADPH)
MSWDYDLFVIGAGSGGVRAARIAAGYGARVAIAEEYRVGGTCVIRGCVPKKLLHYAAAFPEHFAAAAGFGWHGQERARFSWEELIAAKDREIARLNGLYEQTLRNAGVEILKTRAEFAGPHEIFLVSEERVVTAEKILIATGSVPFVPHNVPGAAYAITSNEALHLKRQPPSIAIIGGGYIALEFASIFNALGTETHLLYRGPQILRGFDRELRDELAAAMRARGVNIHVHAEVDRIERLEGKKQKYLVHTRRGLELRVAEVMYAVGRMPNTFDLHLEKAGVETAANDAVRVDEYGRTSQPHIFAVGDVTNRAQLTPVAIREGHAFADREFGGRRVPPLDYARIPTAVFSLPELGTVGLSEEEARSRLGAENIVVYRTRFRPMRNTLGGSGERTFFKLVCEREQERLLGIHLLGPEAPELIQLAATLLEVGARKADLDRTIAVHPTAAEELVTMRTPGDPYVPNED